MANKEIAVVAKEPVANSNQFSPVPIERRIYVVRNTQVMIDLDLASLYGVENRSLRQTVRRNIDSFPDDFMFRLTSNEANELIANGVSQSVIPLDTIQAEQRCLPSQNMELPCWPPF